MSHHGKEELPDWFGKELAQLKKVTGPTGKYPEGKLNDTDEGEVRIAITQTHKGKVIIDFGTPVRWIGFSKEQAIELANTILEKAKEE